MEKFVNQVICGDCLEIMKSFKDSSVDLFVTSPPYNLKNSTGNGMKDGRGGKWANAALQNGYESYDDNMPYDKYCEWQRECLNEMMRLLKDDGAIFYSHKVIYMIDKANRYGDVWEIKQDMHNPHPVPYPIISSTNANLIVDPFAGSGTTGVSAKRYGRDYILIEKSQKYCEMIQKRLEGVEWNVRPNENIQYSLW